MAVSKERLLTGPEYHLERRIARLFENANQVDHRLGNLKVSSSPGSLATGWVASPRHHQLVAHVRSNILMEKKNTGFFCYNTGPGVRPLPDMRVVMRYTNRERIDGAMLINTRAIASAGISDNAKIPATRTITAPMSSVAKRIINVT